jgi:hypothetical protein
MRMQVEVRHDDEDPLRTLAFRDHRAVRDQAGFLLHLKIQEELARLNDAHADEHVAEVA